MTEDWSGVDPSETYAVVVGIDDYAAGPDWRLRGPVDDAARFVRWFLARGVPAAQILLLASPAEPDAAAELAALGVPHRPARAAEVREVLLRELPARRGRLLWVVWGGHGFVDAQRRRRLYYADATGRDPTTLDLDSALATLGSELLPSFDRQIWTVDACQVHGSGARPFWTAGQETLPCGRAVAGRTQDVLFAAGYGQPAANLGAERTGLFSRELLRLLDEHGLNEHGLDERLLDERGLDGSEQRGFPPDPAVLAERLRRRFEELRAAGLARQAPTYFWFRDRLGNEGQVWREPAGAGPGQPQAVSPAAGAGGGLTGAAPTHTDRLRLLREAVDALLDITEFGSVPGREAILELLRRDVSASIARQATARLEATSVLRTCLRFPGGLPELVEAVRFYADGTPAMDRFERAVAALMAR